MSRPAPPSDRVDAERVLPTRAVVALVLLVVVCRLLAMRSCPIYDDAFITYRYAENLAEGRGLTYNPGAPWEPVLGTTTPGYAVLLAGLIALGVDPVRASLGTNVVADVVTALLLVALLRRRHGALATTVTLVVFAGLPHLARITAGGMEGPVLVALALGAALATTRGRPALAGSCAALACTVRPESVLLVAILAVAHLRRPKALLRFCAPVALVGALTIAALVAAYGTPIPHSVTAKSAAHSPRSLAVSLERWRQILTQAFAPTLLMLPAVPVVAFGLVRTLRARSGPHLFALFALAIVASYLAARPHTWGWYYAVPLVAWCLGLGVGLEPLLGALARRLPDSWRARGAHLGTPTACLALAGAAALVTGSRPDEVTAKVYAPLARFLAEQRSDHGETHILASDIGAVGYWAPAAVILDSEGLVWPDAVPLIERANTRTAQIELIRRHAPEFVVLVAERSRVEALAAAPDLAARYEPVLRLNAWEDHALSPSPESLPSTWRQDYIVYRRRD
ncbi:MAG: hypothetical protein H6828_12740 [Planctomycetes bacterium]|nr:hypothetical protein [Planctomycetota bacterium]